MLHAGAEQHHGRKLRRHYRFRATILHMIGLAIGVATMLLPVGFGQGQLFVALSLVHQALRVIGALYLIYLAWRIATATNAGTATRTARPLSVLQEAAFQCVNVNGWIVAVLALTTYTVIDASLPLQICQIALLSALMALGSVACWTMFGQWLRQFLNTSKRMRWFNLFDGVFAAGLNCSDAGANKQRPGQKNGSRGKA